jgi:hypothetical protein
MANFPSPSPRNGTRFPLAEIIGIHKIRVLMIGGTVAVAFGLPGRVDAVQKKTTVAPASVSAPTSALSSKTAARPAPAGAANGGVKAEVEKKLVALQQQASPGLAIGKATCPDALAKVQATSKKSASKPATYVCTILIEGVAAPYNVEIRDGGFVAGGTFVMSRAKAIIDISKVIEGVRTQLDAADQATAKIECGQARVVLAVVGDQISCTVVYPSGTGNQLLKFVVRDLDGTIALQI